MCLHLFGSSLELSCASFDVAYSALAMPSAFEDHIGIILVPGSALLRLSGCCSMASWHNLGDLDTILSLLGSILADCLTA